MSHTATKDNIVSRKILQPHLNVLSLVAIICKQFIICFGGAIILEAFRLLFCHGWAFHLSDHVLHFNSLCSIVRRVRHFLHIIWLASIWVIWSETFLAYYLANFYLSYLKRTNLMLFLKKKWTICAWERWGLTHGYVLWSRWCLLLWLFVNWGGFDLLLKHTFLNHHFQKIDLSL